MRQTIQPTQYFFDFQPSESAIVSAIHRGIRDIPTLLETTGCCLRTITGGLKRLKNEGYIEYGRKGTSSADFTIVNQHLKDCLVF